MFRTYHLKIKNTDTEYFSKLFAEAKWYSNTIIASDEIVKFDTKSKIAFLTPEVSQAVKFLSSQMRQELKDRVISNLKGLSARKKKGGKVGKLRFRKVVNSISLKNQTLNFSGNRVRFQGNKKWFRVFGLEQLPTDYKIQSATLLRNACGIYLNLTVHEDAINQPQNKSIIGVDVGIKDAIVLSDGTQINTDFSETINHLKKAHKRFSRKTKNSKRGQKAKQLLNRHYQKLANQKKDVTNKILNKFKQFKVCFQDEMIRSWHKVFGRKVQNGILGQLKLGLKNNPDNQMLSRSVATTRSCFECGEKNQLKLSERIYKCGCGYEMPRDKHAARNMIKLGLGKAFVEQGSDLFSFFSEIESKHVAVKREANAL